MEVTDADIRNLRDLMEYWREYFHGTPWDNSSQEGYIDTLYLFCLKDKNYWHNMDPYLVDDGVLAMADVIEVRDCRNSHYRVQADRIVIGTR